MPFELRVRRHKYPEGKNDKKNSEQEGAICKKEKERKRGIGGGGKKGGGEKRKESGTRTARAESANDRLSVFICAN